MSKPIFRGEMGMNWHREPLLHFFQKTSSLPHDPAHYSVKTAKKRGIEEFNTFIRGLFFGEEYTKKDTRIQTRGMRMT